MIFLDFSIENMHYRILNEKISALARAKILFAASRKPDYYQIYDLFSNKEVDTSKKSEIRSNYAG
jgi:hypothetical protein